MVMGYPEFEDEPKPAKDSPTDEVVEQPLPTPGLGGPTSNIEPQEEKVGGIVAKIGIPYKSILGFLTVFLGQLMARATVNDVPVLPEDLNSWLSLLGGSFVAAAVIYFKANVYTTPQATQKVAVAEKKHI